MTGPLRDTQEPLSEAFQFALAEDRGGLIVALYEMPLADVERLVDAAQLIDAEGVEALDLRVSAGEASPGV